MARPAPVGDVLLPVNVEPWSYVAPPFEGHCLQTYRLFLPAGEPPPEGWPVVVAMMLAAFESSPDTTSLQVDSDLAVMVEHGFAVVAARCTVSRTLDDPYWVEECGAAPDLPGHGLFKAPGVVPPDLQGSGVAPYDARAWHMAEKDAVMVLQHARHLARQTAPFAPGDFPVEQQAAMAVLDETRVAAFGRSAGAMAMLWPSVGPERSLQPPFARLGGQHAERSRPDAVALRVPAVWWPIFDDAMSTPTPHLGLDGHSEVVGEVVGDMSLDERVAASALAFEDAARVAQLPVYLSYGDVSVVTDVTPSKGCGLPYCYKGQGHEGFIDGQKFVHAAWSGYAWKYLHPGRTRLVVRDEQAWAQRKGQVQATPFLGPAHDTAQILDMVGWLAQALQQPEPWDAALDAVFVPGDRITGALAEGAGAEPVTLRFEGAEGARFAARARRTDGALVPRLRLFDPDGALLVDAPAKGKGVRSKLKLDLPATGSYRLELLDDGEGAPGGAWRVDTWTRRRLVVSETLLIGHPEGEPGLAIPAVAGAEVRRVRVKRVSPGSAAPLLDGQAQTTELAAPGVDLGGPFGVPLEGLVESKAGGEVLRIERFELPFAGTWTLRLEGADELPGWVAAKARLRLPRGRRTLVVGGG